MPAGGNLAMDMYARTDNPPFDRSPVDGYALKAYDTRGASREQPVCLTVIAQVDAGGYIPNGGKRAGCSHYDRAPVPGGCVMYVCVRRTQIMAKKKSVFMYLIVPVRIIAMPERILPQGQNCLQKAQNLAMWRLPFFSQHGNPVCVCTVSLKSLYLLPEMSFVFPGEPLPPGKIYNSNLLVLWPGLRSLVLPLNESASCQTTGRAEPPP